MLAGTNDFKTKLVIGAEVDKASFSKAKEEVATLTSKKKGAVDLSGLNSMFGFEGPLISKVSRPNLGNSIYSKKGAQQLSGLGGYSEYSEHDSRYQESQQRSVERMEASVRRSLGVVSGSEAAGALGRGFANVGRLPPGSGRTYPRTKEGVLDLSNWEGRGHERKTALTSIDKDGSLLSGVGSLGAGGLDKSKAALVVSLDSLEQSVTKTAKEMDKAAKETAKTSREATALERRKKREEEKIIAAEKKKGTFLHGFLQSALPSPAAAMLARGPGMKQEAFGQVMGASLKGIGTGLGNISFSGMAGLQQAVGAIPGVGGFMAGMLGNAASFTGLAIEHQKLGLGMLPYSGGMNKGGISSAGLQYAGLNALESMPIMQNFLQAGGGTLKGAKQQGMSGLPFAAQTLYGIDAETSGAFLRGGRRGGISGVAAGGEGAGGKAFTSTVADGMKLGLEGSELTKYMKIMADGINRWEQTGIPLARESISSLSGGLASLGIGGTRGVNVASSITNAAQGLSMRGPNNMAELMVLRNLGGYAGGGQEEYWKAKLKLEKGNFSEKEMTSMFKQMMLAGGGGAAGKGTMQSLLSQVGVKMSSSEMDLIEASALGTITPAQQKDLAKMRKERERVGKGAPKDSSAILGGAKAGVDTEAGLMKQKADLTNLQISVGKQIAGNVLGLETASTKMTAAFTTIVTPALNAFTKGALSLSESALLLAAAIGEKGGVVNYATDKLRNLFDPYYNMQKELDNGRDVAIQQEKMRLRELLRAAKLQGGEAVK